MPENDTTAGMAIPTAEDNKPELKDSAPGSVWRAENPHANDGQLIESLIRSSSGIKGCGSNVAKILTWAKDTCGRIRFNELTKKVEVAGGLFEAYGPNDLVTSVGNWLETTWGVFVSTAVVAEQLLHVARQQSYDPVAEYLRGFGHAPRCRGNCACRAWDGKERLASWLIDYCGADVPDDGQADPYNDVHRRRYLSLVGKRFMIGAVARALSPGCKVDTVLVLEGGQGAGKSMAIRALASPAWFSDTPFHIGDKDGLMAAGATWICELAELAALVKSSTSAQKAFLSSGVDKYRPPYGRAQEEFPRRSVFVGTVNPEQDGHVEYLADDTGNRRWWPVRVGVIDVAAIERDRDQLWAEAVHCYTQCAGGDLNHRWWFTADEQKLLDEVTATRREVHEDLYAAKIDKFLDRRAAQYRDRPDALPDGFALSEFLEFLGTSPEQGHRVKRQISKSLRHAGWTSRLSGHDRVSRWYPAAMFAGVVDDS